LIGIYQPMQQIASGHLNCYNSAGKMILEKVLSGLSDKNIRFNALKNLLTGMGFDERIKGDHHIFTKSGIAEIINLQPLKDGSAKAYQVKQVRGIILSNKLHKEKEDV
jgi:hypothetical protein